jgi:hypothetical protein
MTELVYSAFSHPLVSAPPFTSKQYSWEQWAKALPTSSAGPREKTGKEASLKVRLFDALAACKIKTATIAAGHISKPQRDRLFRQLDSLLDVESWDETDDVTTEASFMTLLRMILFLKGRNPALGATSTGNFIASWTEGDNRLTIECKSGDGVRWVLIQHVDGQRESAAGDTLLKRLPAVLTPYDLPRKWFPDAIHEHSA